MRFHVSLTASVIVAGLAGPDIAMPRALSRAATSETLRSLKVTTTRRAEPTWAAAGTKLVPSETSVQVPAGPSTCQV